MGLPNYPLRIRESIEPNIRALAQPSKKGYLPKDYVALLGDSYAEGAGDWYIQGDRSKNSPFQPAHVVHAKTGRDVIAFGSSGAGPQRYIVANFPAAYMYMNKLAFLTVEKPTDIIVYFYEGNDLNDCLRDLRRRLSPTLDKAVIYDDEKMEHYLSTIVQKKDRHFKRADRFTWLYNYQAGIFLVRTLVGVYKYFHEGPELPSVDAPLGKVNKIRLGKDVVAIPDEMHSPSLELNDDQIKIGVHVYKKCIQFLMKQFPDARYGILYVPAPLSVYQLASEDVSIQPYEGPNKLFKSAMVRPNSNKIAGLIKNVAKELDIPFVDPRPRLFERGKATILHGPMDWKHLNQRGYELLSEDIILLLEKMKLRARRDSNPRPTA